MAERTAWQRTARRIRVPMGFVVAVVFLVFARPSGLTLLWGLPLVFAGLWLRGYAAGYVRKNAELTTSGPYARTRNPLYLGSLLIVLGFGVAAGIWWLIVLLLALFAVIYIPTIQGEEQFLRANFAGFDDYAAKVPRLLPRLTSADQPGGAGEFSRKLYLHHREYNALMGAGAIYVALVLLILWRGRH